MAANVEPNSSEAQFGRHDGRDAAALFTEPAIKMGAGFQQGDHTGQRIAVNLNLMTLKAAAGRQAHRLAASVAKQLGAHYLSSGIDQS